MDQITFQTSLLKVFRRPVTARILSVPKRLFIDNLLTEAFIQLRNNRASNRSARTQIDHDIMEGLPVRQWRKTVGVVNTAPPRENSNVTNMRNTGWKELPMPRGSELYSPVCQALLRAARMGQVNRPPPPPLEDEKELGDDEDAEGEVDTGFLATKWTQVPRNMEEPEIEYLAKRRKGLPSAYGGNTGPQATSSAMRKTKVRKVDLEGKEHFLDVLAPEGVMVEGEIVADEAKAILTEAPAPGTVVEGLGVANAEGIVIAAEVMPTPPRRRPPPPKRKPKGPGRGRKKKLLQIAEGATRSNAAEHGSDLAIQGTNIGDNNIKEEKSMADGIGNQDADMGDDSMLLDAEEGSESDDEDGEDGEDGDREEGELSPSPDADAPGSLSGSPAKPIPRIVEPVNTEDAFNRSTLQSAGPIVRDISSSPDLPLAAAQAFRALPANIGAMQENVIIPPPNQYQIDVTTQIEVAQPEPLSNGNVQSRAGHNPLNGLAEPQGQNEDQEDRFPDGDEDLLASFERHLDRNG